MDNHPWLEAFRTERGKQALPSWYVRRLTHELSDHLADARASGSSRAQKPRDSVQLGDSALLGDPSVVARRAGNEFRRRTFLQRHPGLPSQAFAGAAAIALALGGFLMNSSEALAQDYLVNILVKGPDGAVVAAPRIVIPSGKEGTLSFQSGKLDYCLTVRAGKEEPKTALHVVDLKVSSTEAREARTPLASPRITVGTDKKCSATHNGYEFNVAVGTVETVVEKR